MILIHQISNSDLEYCNDIQECLNHNLANPIIRKIVIFSSCIDIEKKVGIDLKSRKLLLMKFDMSIFDMMNYAKKNSKSFVIYGAPFIKFNVDLANILNFDVKKVLKDDGSYYIFDKNLKIKNERDIDDVLVGEKIKIFFKTEKLGYYKNSDFQSISYGWRVSKNIQKPDIPKINPKIDIPKITPNIDIPKMETIDISEQIIERPIKNKYNTRKLDVVIVSVNYNDFLLISLENNSKIFENITVITSSNDFLCQKICEKFKVKCIVTDVMYEDGALFNKGKAINEGIRSIVDPDYILLLDADIVVMEKIDAYSLEDDVFYTSDRYMVNNFDSYQSYISGDLDKDSFLLDDDKGYGFFQLFNYIQDIKYPEFSNDASTDDIIFRDSFNLRKSIEKTILHLGLDSNWKGRCSKSFLDNGQFDNLLKKEFASIEKKNAIDLTDAYRKSVIINKSNLPVENDFEYFETCNKSEKSTGRKILFLIYLNNIGGAEYVSYQHIKMCKELGYSPVVLSAEKGMFFDKIKELDVDLYYSKLYEMDKDSIMNVLFDLSNDCDIIYNCNYFGITPFIKELRTIRDFKYYTIAHSDIEWVVNSLFEYDSITDKYIVIHDKIRTELNKFGVCNTRITTIPNYVDFNKIRKDFEVLLIKKS